MSSLNRAISVELRRILDEQNLTVSAAARMLHISRQAFHSYLSGKSVPRASVLARISELWPFNVVVGDVSFDNSSFTATTSEPVQSQSPRQLELELWKRLDSISERDLHIELKRQGKTLRVAVRIDIPA